MASRTSGTSSSTPSSAQGNGATPPSPPITKPDDEINLDNYRYVLSSSGPGERRQLTIPTGKPKSRVFFRIDPRPDMQREVAIYEYKGDFEAQTYLVAPDMQEVLGEKYVVRAVIRVCIRRPRVISLWAVRVPGTDLGNKGLWIRTAWDIVQMAEKSWVRMEPNDGRTGYDVIVSSGNWPDPELPTQSLDELIRKAFAGCFVNREDHPVLQQLRGEQDL